MGEGSVADEQVVLRAGECVVTVLPRFGGKVSSIQVRGRELLQQPLAPVEPRTRTMSFDAGDASGWDECLPSVAACSVPYASGEALVPDHGDLWRVEWGAAGNEETRERGNKTVSLVGKCFSLPLELKRAIALEETSGGVRLTASYKLTNAGDAPAPWSWAAHSLFAAEAGDRIVLPDSIHSLRLEGSGGNRLGKNNDTVNWPVAKLASGGEADLSLALAADSGVGDKLFAGPVGAEDAWCELSRPSAGVKIHVSFDAARTPYLGLWICYGGWPDREGPKQVCVAMEPATAPVDSLAETGAWSRVLAPGESFDWPMYVDIETL